MRTFRFEGALERRLDRALAEVAPDISRQRARSLIEEGLVFLEGKRCRIASRLVRAGARIVVHDGPRLERAEPEPLRILYEDARVIAVDKRPGERVNETETAGDVSVVARLADRDAFTIHRIDRETSGVVLLAKGKRIAESLSAEFRDREVEKIYLAIAAGAVNDGVLDLPIAADPRRPRARRVHPSGKASVTQVRTIGRSGSLSALELRPLTGRTHQIRVHLAHAGAPIAGDSLYGGPLKIRVGTVEIAVERVLLHALRLAIRVEGRPMTFEAPLPRDFEQVREAGLAFDAWFNVASGP